jgi:hypothetical protein
MDKLQPTRLRFPFRLPLAIIDFEASALTLKSYPIEVGVAIATSFSTPIVNWSSLIVPAPNWDLASQWDPSVSIPVS